jgi:hypothetical protein
MNPRDEILFCVKTQKERYITEMARSELMKVMEKITAGDYEGAAKDYIAAGGSPVASGVSKTTNSYVKEHPETADHMSKFRDAINKAKASSGTVDARPTKYNKAPTEIQVKSQEVGKKGEIETVKIAQGGLAQHARKSNLADRVAKEAALVNKEIEILKKVDDIDSLRSLAKDIALDLSGQSANKDSKIENVEADIIALKSFARDGTGKDGALTIMKDIVAQGYHNYEVFHQIVSNLGNVKPLNPEVEKKVQAIQKIINAKKLAQKEPVTEDAATCPKMHEQMCPFCNKPLDGEVGEYNHKKMHKKCLMKKFGEIGKIKPKYEMDSNGKIKVNR